MITPSQIHDQFVLQDRMNAIVNPMWANTKRPWHRAIMVEAVEALDHFGWKWWKEQKADLPQVRMELIDIWHFVLSELLTKDEANDTQTLAMALYICLKERMQAVPACSLDANAVNCLLQVRCKP